MKIINGLITITTLVILLTGCGGGGGDNSTPPVFPIANAGSDQNVSTGAIVSLDANGSSTSTGNVLSYIWVIKTKPSGSNTNLSDTTLKNPTFTPDIAGEYTLGLIVNDSVSDSIEDTVQIVAINTIRVSNTTDFRAALNSASSNSQDNIIILANGLYKTTDDNLGTFIYSSDSQYELKIIGSSLTNTILSGEETNQILNIYAVNQINVTIDNITLQKGNAGSESGGALYINTSSTLNNVLIKNNKAGSGAGIFADDSPLVINNCVITENNATNNGGGIYVNSRLDLNNTTISNNFATYRGGGINGRFSSKISIDNSTISHNISGDIAGGFMEYGGVTILNSIIEFNSGARNGGFYTNGNSLIMNSIINGNSSTGDSQPITVIWTSNIVNSLFINNDNGLYTYEGNINIVNSAFVDNGTNEIFDNGSSTNLYLSNCYVDTSKVVIGGFVSEQNTIYNGSPDFIDTSTENYHLSSSSIMINAGINEYKGITIPVADLDGNSRPSGSITDIGPYEYQQ